MNKITLILFAGYVFTIIACGSEEKNKKNKKDKSESDSEEEVERETEEEVDYSYVLPQIDTSALNSESEILAAMEKVVVARKTDDSLAENVSGYAGYYTELTTLYATVLNKGTEYMGTLKGKAALEFNEKLTAITNKMYE